MTARLQDFQNNENFPHLSGCKVKKISTTILCIAKKVNDHNSFKKGPPKSVRVEGNAGPYQDGDTVVLTCHVEADKRGDISIEWLKEGKVVDSAKEREHRFVGYSFMSGKYSCRAKNSAGAVLSRNVNVTISKYTNFHVKEIGKFAGVKHACQMRG